MEVLQEIFGKFVLNNKGSAVPVSSLVGPDKVIGLYFYGNWCLPCQHFTKQLKTFYDKLKSTNWGENFEIIGFPSDTDDNENADCSTLPWYCADHQSRAKIERASQKFGVESVPTLILLDGKTGKVITDRARRLVIEDPTAQHFPWREESQNERF